MYKKIHIHIIILYFYMFIFLIITSYMRYTNIFSDIVLNLAYVCLFTTLLQNNFKAYFTT